MAESQSRRTRSRRPREPLGVYRRNLPAARADMRSLFLFFRREPLRQLSKPWQVARLLERLDRNRHFNAAGSAALSHRPGRNVIGPISLVCEVRPERFRVIINRLALDPFCHFESPTCSMRSTNRRKSPSIMRSRSLCPNAPPRNPSWISSYSRFTALTCSRYDLMLSRISF